MSCFNILCEVLERLDDETYNALMEEKSSRIIPALSEITADGLSGVQIYVDFVICAVAADGKLTEAEYQLIKPILDLSMEADVGYGDAQKFFYDNGLDKPEGYKNSMDSIADLLGLVSQELKDDIVLLCMLVCAVDGEMSDEEREWIQQLIE